MTPLEEILKKEGYENLREINGKWYGTMRMLFTTGLFCDLTSWGNRGGRLCFETKADAVNWLKNWDGVATPTKRDGLTADKRTASEKGNG